jgi:hypothetical protein
MTGAQEPRQPQQRNGVAAQSRIPSRLRRISRCRLIDPRFLRGMAGVIYRLGPDVLRFNRGRSPRGTDRFQFDSDDHTSCIYLIAVRLTCSRNRPCVQS